MLGTLFTTNIGGMRRIQADEYWSVTRGGGDIAGTTRVKELAPSPDLYRQYLSQWRGRPPEGWWSEYERLFLAEMQAPVAVEGLRVLYRRLQSAHSVALVCYCSDPDHCHRRLLGDFLSRHGVTVVEACQAKALRLL